MSSPSAAREVRNAARGIALLADSPAWARFQQRKQEALEQFEREIAPLVTEPIAEYERACQAERPSLISDSPANAEAVFLEAARRTFALLIVSCARQAYGPLTTYKNARLTPEAEMVAAMPSRGAVE